VLTFVNPIKNASIDIDPSSSVETHVPAPLHLPPPRSPQPPSLECMLAWLQHHHHQPPPRPTRLSLGADY